MIDNDRYFPIIKVSYFLMREWRALPAALSAKRFILDRAVGTFYLAKGGCIARMGATVCVPRALVPRQVRYARRVGQGDVEHGVFYRNRYGVTVHK
ncbi:hypothetical protein [Ochrobactrum sp. POC9]|uniref:hypothetical protein n=1 Tax=Ochrobactrum sp. POC9 TaxID=2203419 RepID=UPI0011B251E5|nr:hypothetical protein [Ochrobactrum sp. POC9]